VAQSRSFPDPVDEAHARLLAVADEERAGRGGQARRRRVGAVRRGKQA